MTQRGDNVANQIKLICSVTKVHRRTGDRCKVTFDSAVNELSSKLSAKQYPSRIDIVVALSARVPICTSTHVFEYVPVE